MLLRTVAGGIVFILLLVAPSRAENSTWTVLGGYGVSHVGMGETREHVETADIVLRYAHVLVDGIGADWYAGRHDLLAELPVSFVTTHGGQMIGMNFLASYFFTSFDRYEPYLFLGGGPVYVEPPIPGMSRHLNGNYQAGAGVAFKVSPELNFDVEYRFHHISNAGAALPNVPLNSSKLLVGITFLR